MMDYNAYFEMRVSLTDGYRGNYRLAIDEAFTVSKRIGVKVRLVYAGQKAFILTPETTDEDIETMKNERFTIGV